MPNRRVRPDAEGPAYAVWELTMRCDQPCTHCGSRAGAARPRELTPAEAADVARQLAAIGVREVTLIGGEAYLRADIYDLVALLASLGVVVTMQTGGRAFTEARARRFKDAGLFSLGVSVDGPEAAHDTLRGNTGSWAAAMRALEIAHKLGMPTTVNTQVNRLTADLLWETVAPLRDRKVRAWRAQLTAPMGEAADRPDVILEPWRVVDAIDTLAAIQKDALANPRPWELPFPKRAFDIQLGNNLGYYGPHEGLLRSRPGGERLSMWGGCNAGVGTISVESDGTLKACPSLPTAPYRAGTVFDVPIAEAWREHPAMRFAREPDLGELWGFCKTCDYADVCRGGCNFTAHATLGRRGNNPFCYHRAALLRRRGRRERLVQVTPAEGVPYDFGRFEIVEEDWGEG